MFTPNYKQDKIADLFHEEILPGTFPLCYNEKQFTWALSQDYTILFTPKLEERMNGIFFDTCDIFKPRSCRKFF